PFTFSKLRKKLMMAVHGSGKYSYLYWGRIVGTIYNVLEKISVRNCSKVIVLLKRDEYGVPYYKKRYFKHSNKIVYGKVPIDLTLFKELNKKEIREKHKIDDTEKVLIYFGRLDDNPKRVLLIPNIVENLSARIENIKCIIIGDGEDKSKLIEKCKELNIEDKFIFYNKISHGDKLTELVNLADISIILSTFEGICMSALESLACNVPVLATDVGDVNEYIYNSTNGIIIKNVENNIVIDEASNKIFDYLTDKVSIKIDDVYKHYSGETVMDELNNIFYEVSKVE
ncbi:MAG: glycosyltransferase family 4 protein, partial [Clostridium sp.]|nr:glycosyltransferase family 4 protein [Clostridium sp.]